MLEERRADARAAADADPLSEREVLRAARARAHEPGDRQAALHLRANGGDAPGARHAEAATLDGRRARAARAVARTGLGRVTAALGCRALLQQPRSRALAQAAASELQGD